MLDVSIQFDMVLVKLILMYGIVDLDADLDELIKGCKF